MCSRLLKLFGDATYDRRPDSKDFNHVAKRRRRSTKQSPSAATTPAIHVHLPGYEGSAPSPSPLADHSSRHANTQPWAKTSKRRIIDLTTSDDDTPLVVFPLISQILQELHNVMPLLDYPQYEAALTAKGIMYVNNVIAIAQEFFINTISMPEGAVGDFLKHSLATVCRAEKVKKITDMVAIKKEEVEVTKEEVEAMKEEDKEN